jgi:hypothetical protein
MVQFETSAARFDNDRSMKKGELVSGIVRRTEFCGLNSEGWTTGGASADDSRKRHLDDADGASWRQPTPVGQTARSVIFDDIYRNRGALRQQLAALETTVEETK